MQPHDTIPYGFCHCGCGKKTNLSTQNHTKRGLIKGQPRQYIQGHNSPNLLYGTLEEHFWAFCIKRGPSECWDWSGYKSSSGHGRFSHRDVVHLAHRTSWEIHFGPIPDGMCVCHKCDYPPCTNPNHLFLGTQSDNARDMVIKGRHYRHRTT